MALQPLAVESEDERIIIRYEPRGPVHLAEFAGSLGALEKLFESNFGLDQGSQGLELYVERIEKGSIEVVLLPMLTMFGGYVEYMGAAVTLRDFAAMLIETLKKFAGEESSAPPLGSDTVQQIREFIKPLSGKKGATLNVKHARFATRNGAQETVVEYTMQEPAINLAAADLSRTIASTATDEKRNSPHREVLMRLFQAKMSEGRERGRTGDRAIIPDVSDRDLPLYFPKQASYIKDRIMTASENPFSKGYIVDVLVEYIGGVPKLYRLTHLHEIIDI